MKRDELLALAREIVDENGGGGFGLEMITWDEHQAHIILEASGFKADLHIVHSPDPGVPSGLTVRQKIENGLGAVTRGRLGYIESRES